MADLRKTSLLVAGQEVLTSDNVGIKTSLLVTYQVTDPVKAAHETQNWQGDLYNAAQIALRAVVGGVPSKRCSVSDSTSARNCSPAFSRTPPRSASTSRGRSEGRDVAE